VESGGLMSLVVVDDSRNLLILIAGSHNVGIFTSL